MERTPNTSKDIEHIMSVESRLEACAAAANFSLNFARGSSPLYRTSSLEERDLSAKCVFLFMLAMETPSWHWMSQRSSSKISLGHWKTSSSLPISSNVKESPF